jgi:hypothetical protein
MRFGIFQIVLGIVLMAAGPVFGGPAWVFMWPGWSVFVVGLGYVGLGPRVFGKNADGELSPYLVVMLFPYFVVAWVLWQLKSRLERDGAWHEVAPGVRLGRRPLSLAELPPGTRCVVDLTAEFPRVIPKSADVRYVCVPTLDTSIPPDAELRALVDAIAEEEGPIFVHCAMGRGRSAAVAAALLMRRGVAGTVDEAVLSLTKSRPGVRLHAIQREALVRMSAVPMSAVRTSAVPMTTK